MQTLLQRTTSHLTILLISPLLLGSCGFGTAGILGTSGGGSGGSANAPSTPAGLLVINTKTSPATIRIAVNDAEGDDATIRFFYVLPGESTERELQQIGSNPVTLAGTPDGTSHDLTWDFPLEDGLPSDSSFVSGVELIARFQRGPSQSAVTNLGNDAPVVDSIDVPPSEISGIVNVGFRVADTSGDSVDIDVEFFDEGDPAAGWRPARSAGFPFQEVVAPPGGRQLVFFWDTASRDEFGAPLGDLVDMESTVRLRFLARDSVAAQVQVPESDSFRVDNNDAPILQIGEGFVASEDDRRGILIPFTVIDDEGDPVRVVFQWRLEAEAGFPSLGTTDPGELSQLMLDPDFVREKHICTPFSSAKAGGYAVPVDDTRVRLPELMLGESSVLAAGVAFRDLELLRPQPPASLAATWSQNPLSSPMAVQPLGDGITAVVLDGAMGTSRLLEVDLATGSLVRTIAAALPGAPTALALSKDERQALIATDAGGWNLFRVALDGNATSLLIAAGAGGAAQPTGPLRAVLALGRDAALATADDSLWRLDWSNGTGSIVRLRSGLAAPWGLVHDPVHPGRVLIAERDADRILSFDLLTGAQTHVLATRDGGGVALPRPTSIDTRAGRLIVLCDAPLPQQRDVCGLDLGSSETRVYSLGLVSVDATTIASGPFGLLLAALPTAADLVAGGGIEQRRQMVSVDQATVTVTEPFQPPVRQLQSWRIDKSGSFFVPVQSTAEGSGGLLVWNSKEIGVLGRVLIRATPMDTESGIAGRTTVSKMIENADNTVVTAPSPSGLLSFITAADLDGDGDLDIAAVDRIAGQLSIFHQDEARTFVPAQTLTTETTPFYVAAGDLDGDGRQDLVCCNRDSHSLSLFFQGVPPQPLATGPVLALAAGSEPLSVAIADLNGDGAADLVCTNYGTGNLKVFFQDAPSPNGFVVQSTTTIPTGTGSGPGAIVVADLDADGDLDIACVTTQTSKLLVFLQSPAGSFVPQSPIDTASLPTGIAAGDLDDDGDLDLITCSFGVLEVFEQDEQHGFSLRLALPVAGSPQSVATADVNGDGDLDIVSSNWFGDTVSVLFQTTELVFAPPQYFDGGLGPTNVTPADFDGDGMIDLACGNFVGGTMHVIFQDAPQAFTPPEEIAVGGFPTGATSTDLDLDGDLDLVAVSTGTNSLRVYFQDGPRTFTPGQTLSTGLAPGSPVVADLDGDGDMDIVCANAGSNNLSIFYQDATRTFTERPALPTGILPESVLAVDIDGDGDLDLVCANAGSGTLSWFLQDATTGLFVAQPDLHAEIEPAAVVAADFDGDGDIDLVCANAGSNNLSLFVQGPVGVFAPAGVLAQNLSRPRSLVAGDLDADGDMDLVCANEDASALSVLIQGPLGTFSPGQELPTSAAPDSVVISDVDGDGTLDLVCVVPTSNYVLVFLQRSPLTFTGQSPISVAALPVSVAVADLDGDGDADLVTANFTSSNLGVLFGRGK